LLTLSSYLILEYIDQGDLFHFINSRGRLPEEVALCFFRQMMSAISYCHSFNVCHRDLKPENILITADFQIKIADFGMAALHQTATHQLATACGSPHYAAPELLKNRHYRGDRSDIWSMGVILYAMLSATLPFDDPNLRAMMNKTKKGHYEMPKGLSPEAEDLIRRMLQVNPDRRITMKDIWQHPLVRKYSYLDEFGDNTAQLPDTRKGFQFTPVAKPSIDPQLLRQLRSMWHMSSEHDLTLKLTSAE
jgi:serine/threonine protein kinase